ncbi:TetR family transcriptional regulator C-terminal domain-containing protein [Nonomuraea sp. CA-141351]|uniref:SbtR family transcriptional regulator n=1 Tax=Nonomuraea sp. CA-141351 TaxID=3239996 RepID=UPI003D94D274
MMETLRACFASGRIAAPSRERVTSTIATILEQGVAAGTLRADADPEDVTTMLVGVFLSITAGASQKQTDRLLDLLTDAIRPRASAGTDS